MSVQDQLNSMSFNIAHDDMTYVGFSLKDIRESELPDDVVLATVKTTLKALVDNGAEALRSVIVTPGAGQAMEYQEVQSQALAALKAPSSATPDKYPMLAATIGVDVDPSTNEPATDVLGVARSISAAYEQWKLAGSAIRGTRLTAKKNIEAATSIAAAVEAFDAITWPSLG